jgi:phosphonate transport system substrate-binding protein
MPSFIALALALLLLLGPLSCSDQEAVRVDFTQTTPAARSEVRASQGSLRVAVGAMISPRETFDLYRQLLEYLGRRLGRDLEFVQRQTYGEINELLHKGEIDLAFICSGPYVTGKKAYGFAPLAVPVMHGSHFYRSYLIVNNDKPYHSLEDLRGRTFAFTDPDSNTGRLAPLYWLALRQERPETYFGHTIYTYSHDNSILAVARGLVDGAAVDGLIWEYYQEKNPALTSRTRIIKKSEPYGIPPLVVSHQVKEGERQRLQEILLEMHKDPEGRKILAELYIDRFEPLQEEWYEPIRQMHRYLVQFGEKKHGRAPENP